MRVLYFCLLVFVGVKAYTQEKEANNPLPLEYLEGDKKIYLDDKIEFINSRFIIFAQIYGVPDFALGAIIVNEAENQQRIKEDEIAKEIPYESDSILINEVVYSSYFKVLEPHSSLVTTEENADYILSIKIYDHGFHWASSSALGVFIRIVVELKSADEEVLWSQFYHLDKQEAKIPHNRGGMTLNKCADKLLADYKKDPELLKYTYEQISTFLAAKLFQEN